MRKYWILLVLVTVALTLGRCQVSKPRLPMKSPPYHLIAYISGSDAVSTSAAARLTHINYAFARIDSTGALYFSHRDAAEHLAGLRALKETNPYLKILISIGGWGADYFSDVALTDASRSAFARRVGALVERHQFDGVDLDWEYPGQPGPGIMYRPEDKQNFTLLLAALRDELDRMSDAKGLQPNDHYLLTIAANDDPAYFEHTEMDTVHTFLDFINVMTYDFYTSGSPSTGHHTGLYASKVGSPAYTIQAGIERHLEAGVPPEKLIVGAAFYGRGWTGVAHEQQGRYQDYETFYGAYGYSTLQEQYIGKNGFERHWDDTAKAPYLWNPDSSIFISYDDVESLRHKAAFTQTYNLGGMMYWEHRLDAEGELLEALYDALMLD